MAKNIMNLVTEAELRRILAETIINRTEKVNKISPHSVLAGIIAGNAKIGKKAMKDIFAAMSRISPSTATGEWLDKSARDFGITERLGPSRASVMVKMIADPGTQYYEGIHSVSTVSGTVFDIENDLTIGPKGFGYVKARSRDFGGFTNPGPFTVEKISPEPEGHTALTNEYKGTGGRDDEQDDAFRNRIMKGANMFAEGTLEKYAQVFLKSNTDVLRVMHGGRAKNGKLRLVVASQNGTDFTEAEMDSMLSQGSKFFSWEAMGPTSSKARGVELVNVQYQYIDVSLRLSLQKDFDIVEVIKSIQNLFSKAVDYRFWKMGEDKVDRAQLLNIVRAEKGVLAVPERYFFPGSDILVDRDKLPRFRGFIAKDLDGTVLLSQSGTIDPVFYPKTNDDFLGYGQNTEVLKNNIIKAQVRNETGTEKMVGFRAGDLTMEVENWGVLLDVFLNENGELFINAPEANKYYIGEDGKLMFDV